MLEGNASNEFQEDGTVNLLNCQKKKKKKKAKLWKEDYL